MFITYGSNFEVRCPHNVDPKEYYVLYWVRIIELIALCKDGYMWAWFGYISSVKQGKSGSIYNFVKN